MNEQVLEENKEERYIGVILSMKPTAQCTGAAKTAQKVLGQLVRAFHYRDRHVFLRLYKHYVWRPVVPVPQPYAIVKLILPVRD